MAILRINTVGAGGDFSNLQNWFLANKGNLVSSGLICVAELLPGVHVPSVYESNSFGGPSGAYHLKIGLGETTTDINHFYWISTKPANRFNGDFSNTNVPILSGGSIQCLFEKSRFDGFVITDVSTPISWRNTISAMDVYDSIVDGVGFNNIGNSGIVDTRVIFFGHNNTVRNCVFNNCFASGGSNFSLSAVGAANPNTTNWFLNNTVANFRAVNPTTSNAFSIVHYGGASGQVAVYNNLLFNSSVTGSQYINPVLTQDYNAADNVYLAGSYSISGINVANTVTSSGVYGFDARLKSSATILGSGMNLTQYFRHDLTGEPRGTVAGNVFTPSFDIGADQYGSGVSSEHYLTPLFINSHTGYCRHYDDLGEGNVIIDTVGPHECARFPDLETWWGARKGDLVSSGIIVIAQLVSDDNYVGGGEAFKRPLVYNRYRPALQMNASECVTGPNNYYIIRGYYGDTTTSRKLPQVLDNNSVVDVSAYGSIAISGNVPYTRFENLVVGFSNPFVGSFQSLYPKLSNTDLTGLTNDPTYYQAYPNRSLLGGLLITSGIIDSCHISTITNDLYNVPQGQTLTAFGIQALNGTVVRNCFISNITCRALSGSGLLGNGRPTLSYGIYAPLGANRKLYNNTINYIHASQSGFIILDFSNVSHAYGIYSNGNDEIYNNIITNVSGYHYGSVVSTPIYQCIETIDSTVQLGYNITQDNTASGSGSMTNVTPSALFQLMGDNAGSVTSIAKLRSGAPAIGAGVNLWANTSGISARQFNWDMWEQPRGYSGTWDIGCDEYIASGDSYSFNLAGGVRTYSPEIYLIAKGVEDTTSSGITLFLQNQQGSTSSGINLVIPSGTIGVGSGTDLYLHCNLSQDYIPLIVQQGDLTIDGFNLFVGAGTFTGTSGNAFLYMAQAGSGAIGSGLNLFSKGVSGIDTGSLNLVMVGPTDVDVSGGLFPLYIKVGDTGSGTLGLFTQCRTPESGLGSVDLYIGQHTYTSGNLNLYIGVPVSGTPVSSSGSFNLFCQAGDLSADSAQLFIENHSASSVSGFMPLYLDAIYPASGGMNLTLIGPSTAIVSGSVPLFLDSHPYSGIPLYISGTYRQFSDGLPLHIEAGTFRSLNNNASLFLYSTTNSGLYSYHTLYTTGSGPSGTMNLFIAAPSSVYNTGNLNLSIKNIIPTLQGSTDLFVCSNWINSPTTLYTKGLSFTGIDDGSNEGYIPANSYMNLYIGKASEGMVNLVMNGAVYTNMSGNITTFTKGISGTSSSGMNLIMQSHLPIVTGVELYSHGFNSSYRAN